MHDNLTPKALTPEAIEAYFWARVDRSGGPDACWEWQGQRTKGYGRMELGSKRHRRIMLAHRYSYELATGAPLGDRLACHSCDNPPCCNPAHIFPGTHQDNTDDRVRKGRSGPRPARGERHHKAKLTADDVRTIRRLYATGGHSQRDLARRFGLAQSTIGSIIRGEYWKDVC